jgi:hypothetical protein
MLDLIQLIIFYVEAVFGGITVWSVLGLSLSNHRVFTMIPLQFSLHSATLSTQPIETPSHSGNHSDTRHHEFLINQTML